jgi:hypothetical protein
MRPPPPEEITGLNFRYGVLPNGFGLLVLHLTECLEAWWGRAPTELPYPAQAGLGLGIDDIERDAMIRDLYTLPFPPRSAGLGVEKPISKEPLG